LLIAIAPCSLLYYLLAIIYYFSCLSLFFFIYSLVFVSMRKSVSQSYTDLICPKCRKPFVFIDNKAGQVKKSAPNTQKKIYCRNCGFIMPEK